MYHDLIGFTAGDEDGLYQSSNSPLQIIESFLEALTNADKDGRIVVNKQGKNFSLLSIRHQVVLIFCFNSAWFEGKQTFSSNPLGQRVPYFFYSRGNKPALSPQNFNTLSRKWIVGKCRQTHELGIAVVTLIKYQILLASLQENI